MISKSVWIFNRDVVGYLYKMKVRMIYKDGRSGIAIEALEKVDDEETEILRALEDDFSNNEAIESVKNRSSEFKRKFIKLLQDLIKEIE